MTRNRRRPKAARVARPKLHLDESVSVWVADVLGKHHHVTTARSARLRGRSDADHFAYGWRHGKVVVTHDMDFWNYRNPELPDTRNPGTIVLACGSGDTDSIDEMLPVLMSLRVLVGADGWKDTRVMIGHKGVVQIRRRVRDTGKYLIEEYRMTEPGVFTKVVPRTQRKR